MTDGVPIAVFGGTNIDRLATASVPITPGASNPGRLSRRVGGVGFHVATILARVGHRVRLVARVGKDDDGRMILTEVDSAGVDGTGITYSAVSPTASYTAVFDDDGDLFAGIADMSVFDEMLPDAGLPGHGVVGEFMVVDANLPDTGIAHLCQHAEARQQRLAALAVSPYKARRLLASLDKIDCLFANRAEAASLIDADADTAAIEALAEGLLARGVAAAVVTDGADAMAIAEGDSVTIVTPPTVDVVHVNGAGDSLAAGTIHSLATGAPLASAVYTGLAAAALTLEHGGVREAMFSGDRLDAMTELIKRER